MLIPHFTDNKTSLIKAKIPKAAEVHAEVHKEPPSKEIIKAAETTKEILEAPPENNL